MSTNLPRCASLAQLPAMIVTGVLLSACGCMYQQPMYQPYGYPYGQPMYQSAPGYSTPGTLVIPPSSSSPYPLGGSSGGRTFEDDGLKSDDFRRDNGTGTNDSRFFSPDQAGGVPSPRDPGGSSSNDTFNRELTNP